MSPLNEFIGDSAGIRTIRETVVRLLDRYGRRLPVILLQGQTGSGKTLLARCMHRASARRDGPFVEHNCPATPDSLLESEVFGYKQGAFTGAVQSKPGLFHLAHRGTLLLDEIGDMSEAMQRKLLKVIEDKSFRRVGGDRTESVDVWLIAASNVDLRAAVRDGKFREDLYHRLNVVTLRVPALRERVEDIVPLAEAVLRTTALRHGVAAKGLDAAARKALRAYAWPGNVRELANVMERVTVLGDGDVITAEMLELTPMETRNEDHPPLRDELGTLERDRLVEALRESNGNLSDAARRLRIPRNTLRYRAKKFGVLGDSEPQPGPTPPDDEPAAAPLGPSGVAPEDTHARPEDTRVRWESRHLAVLRAVLAVTSSDWPAETGRALDTLADKVEAFGGHVEEWSPSGLTAAFGLEPTEDAPRRAAHAAIALVKAVEQARADGEPIALTVGLHVGRFQIGVGRQGTHIDLAGKQAAWGLLERLLARAVAGTVVVTEEARPFLDRRFGLASLAASGDIVERAHRLAVPESSGLGIGPRVSPFVGRHRNLEMLEEALTTVTRGRGQFVGILGEPGMGKSRLLTEFRRALAARPLACLEGACFSYASSVPYVPVLAMLRQSCGLTVASSREEIGARLRRRLEGLGMSVSESAPYLLHLLGLREAVERLSGLEPEAIKLRTHQALRQMIAATSRQQPLVLVAEDLHWADRSSEELFASLVTDMPDAPIMFIATYRPGYRPPWMDRSLATQMALPPLSPEESVALVRSAIEGEVPEPVTRFILDKAEGNPFFLEEMCRTLENGRGPTTSPAVPDTIEQVLTARIARLPAVARNVLECAAVLGREFPADLLAALAGGAGSLDAELQLLTGLEFLYPRTAGSAVVHVFKHALTQEVAYGSLSPGRRQSLHAAAGRAIESMFADRLEEAYDRLAHHFSRSTEAATAVEYLVRFADKSARADAHEEAIEAVREALRHTDRLSPDVRDRRRLEVVLQLPESLLRLGRIEELCTVLLQERERLERVGDPALVARASFFLARAFMLSQHQRALEHAQRAIAAAERCGDTATMGGAYGVLAVARVLSGEARRGIEESRRAVGLLEGTTAQWSLAYAHWANGLCCSQTGAFREALDAERRALAVAETIGAEAIEASAIWVIGLIHAAMGNWEEGVAECERAVGRTRNALYRALALGILGFAHLQKGAAPPAVAALEESVALMRRFGLIAFEAWFTAFLAEAHRLDGRLDTAQTAAARALDLARKADFGVAVGWAQQALGRAAQERGDLESAAAGFEAALEVFCRIDSPYEQARARLDLAVLYRARAGDASAQRHLEEAHRLFTLLDVPVYRARVEGLAADWAVALAASARP